MGFFSFKGKVLRLRNSGGCLSSYAMYHYTKSILECKPKKLLARQMGKRRQAKL